LFRRRRREGLRSAVRIQSTFRMHKTRLVNSQFALQARRQTRKRHEASIKIQTQMRRFLRSKYMQARRVLFNNSARHIQRVFRGHAARRLLKIDWAARRIARFMKKLHFFKFKDAVIMIMQLRRFFKKRNLTAIELQRVYRGYLGRMYVFRTRLWRIISRTYATKLQRFWRKVLLLRGQVPFKYPSQTWVHKQCAKKLAHMILELYLDSMRRQELQKKLIIATPQVQKLVRGFLARRGRSKLKFLRVALLSWFQPQFAMDFMSEFLRNRIVDNHCLTISENRPSNLTVEDDINKGKLYIRKYLPVHQRKDPDVDFRSFDSAIAQWYESIHLPLMESEKLAIIQTFKNPMNGKIYVRALDEFIDNHKQPCRQHGRRVCGSCFFRKQCTIRNCPCNEYKKNHNHQGGICRHCDHPKSLHAIFPLQCKYAVAYEGKKKVPLLDLLAFRADVDMSIPVNVTGVAIENVLIRELDDDDKREARREVMLENRKKRVIAAQGTGGLIVNPLVIHSTSKTGSLGRVATEDEKHLLSRTLARLEVSYSN
jgi:hypothetical protein